MVEVWFEGKYGQENMTFKKVNFVQCVSGILCLKNGDYLVASFNNWLRWHWIDS